MVAKLHREPLVAAISEHMRRVAPPTAMAPAMKLRLAVKEDAPSMAKKKSRKLQTPEFKAKAVARALQAKETGSETIGAIAKDIGVSEQSVYAWIKKAKEQNAPKPAKGAEPKEKATIKSLSRELADALEKVSAIKKRLRKMLGDD